jgi:hypothetical protein
LLAVSAAAILLLGSGPAAGTPNGLTAANGEPECSQEDYRCDKEFKRKGRRPATEPGNPGSGGKPQPCVNNATNTVVPCSSAEWGTWSNARQCYLSADPSPKPAPGGATGRWYLCHRLDQDPAAGGTAYEVWLEEAPAVDPGQLALDILARLQLQKIQIGITPEQGKTGLVGLPTYLWVDNPGPRTLGPITDSATQGNVTVTLTATVDHVTWSLGDGTTLRCRGTGTPYQDAFGAAPSPTCGHTYRRPSTSLTGGAYPVSATAVWRVEWTGAGQSGSIPFQITANGTVRIGEAQALN